MSTAPRGCRRLTGPDRPVFTGLGRIDCVLEATKEKMLGLNAKLTGKVDVCPQREKSDSGEQESWLFLDRVGSAM